MIMTYGTLRNSNSRSKFSWSISNEKLIFPSLLIFWLFSSPYTFTTYCTGAERTISGGRFSVRTRNSEMTEKRVTSMS